MRGATPTFSSQIPDLCILLWGRRHHILAYDLKYILLSQQYPNLFEYFPLAGTRLAFLVIGLVDILPLFDNVSPGWNI